jgi:hypothetical protein
MLDPKLFFWPDAETMPYVLVAAGSVSGGGSVEEGYDRIAGRRMRAHGLDGDEDTSGAQR